MIVLEEVTKNYGALRAVDGISLRVEAGEIFGLLGPNGAGKTTTLRLMGGIILPDSGRITIGGISLLQDPVAAKKIIGFIPDRPYVYEKLTGREFLQFIADVYRLERSRAMKRADSLLEMFGLDGRQNDLVESYSHGMKQRLVIISALLHDPQVIIVDEPMVGLDPAGVKLVRETLQEQAKRGSTVFLSTHTLSLAEEICDRIGIIHRGRLLATGTMEELRHLVQTGVQDLESIFLKITMEDIN
ncbi:MAG: ABC transporter ATP-binding protein [Syntrophales bacterium]|nr:ABC transporter ATP-binding protein [Syntrophales bacterium]